MKLRLGHVWLASRQTCLAQGQGGSNLMCLRCLPKRARTRQPLVLLGYIFFFLSCGL